ncbi:MAG: hypothetical protein ACPL7G_02725 [Chloroflexia bacterium]
MRRYLLLLLAVLALLGAVAIFLGQVVVPGRLRVHLGGSPVIAPGESWGGDVVVIGGGLAVQGVVEGNAVAFGGPVRVGGRVDGDVVSLGGEVVLQSPAEVGGNVVTLGGKLRRAAGASVRGDILEGLSARSVWAVPGEDRPASFWQCLGPALLATVAVFVLCFFLAWGLRSFWPRRSRVMVETLRRRLLSCLGLGLAGGVFLAVVLPLLVLLLLVSLVGVLLVPFLLLLVGLLYLLSLAVCGLALGEAMVGRGEGRTWLPPAAGLAVVVPLAVVPALLVPWLGPAWATLLAGAGLGAIAQSRLGTLEAVPVPES